MLKDSYTAAEIVRITGLTPKQVRHWTDIGLILPSVAAAKRGQPEKSGKARKYNWADLLAWRAVQQLHDAGVKVTALRKVADHLKSYGQDFSNTWLLTVGDDVCMVRGEDLESALRQPGQIIAAAFLVNLEQTQTDLTEAVKKMMAA